MYLGGDNLFCFVRTVLITDNFCCRVGSFAYVKMEKEGTKIINKGLEDEMVSFWNIGCPHMTEV